MKAIIIEESEFEREFNNTLDRLKADCFDCLLDKDELNQLKAMHRKFHYEISVLKSRLVDGRK